MRHIGLLVLSLIVAVGCDDRRPGGGNPMAPVPLTSPGARAYVVQEAGGTADTHQGGRQFASQDDPDWKNMEAWVRGQKASGSSAP